MPGSRLNAVLLSFSLFAVGCGQSAPPPPPAPAGPSLADQLTAAKELVAVAEEKHRQAVSEYNYARELLLQVDEAEVETQQRLEKVLSKLGQSEFQAKLELDEAKARVRRLAREMTAE